MPLIQPESVSRRSLPPELRQFPTLTQEGVYMAIVYPTGFIGEEMAKQLKLLARIPVQHLSGAGDKKRFDPAEDSVKVLTMHSSKGLEFPGVGIPGLGYMPHRDHDIHEEAKLLYVAMTRAMDTLILTASKASPFVSRIQRVHEQAAKPGGDKGIVSSLMGFLGR